METVAFSFYDAFSDVAFGGSQAGVVTEARDISVRCRRQIAREIGAPATAFVDSCTENSVTAQFFSTVMELPMCGHGTICMATRLIETGALIFGVDSTIKAELRLPTGAAFFEISHRDDGRYLIMLDIQPPGFSQPALDEKLLAGLLGLETGDYSQDLPIEIASGDFIHLVVPLAGLESMGRIVPDFSGLTRFCREHGIETVALFCTEVELANSNIHVRDFCPAVGVSESAAAGTTNGALASYLVRHGIVQGSGDSRITVKAEQGHEIGRPSSIRSVVTTRASSVERLQVGGVATKIMDGQLYLEL